MSKKLVFRTFALLMIASALLLQTNTRPATASTSAATAAPVVQIFALDPVATENGPTSGTFMVWREKKARTDLPVFYTLSGTATNGQDYSLSGQVIIPANALSVLVNVVPFYDYRYEGNETVVVTLYNPNCDFNLPYCYHVGPSNSATITIEDYTYNPYPY